MQLAKPVLDPAHVAVGVVDGAERIFETREGVLAELDDLGGVPSAQQVLDRVDDLHDALRVVVQGAVVHEATGVQHVLDGDPVLIEVGVGSLGLGRLEEQASPQELVVPRFLEEEINQPALVEPLEMAPQVDGRTLRIKPGGGRVGFGEP